jgi:nitrate/nitrite transporter NarK
MAGVALLGSFLLADRSFALAFSCLVVCGGCMYAPYGPYWAIVPERLPKEVVAEILAMINTCGALGGFVGSYLVGWLQAVTGKPRAGFLLMSVALVIAGLLVLWLPSGIRRGNEARSIRDVGEFQPGI